MERGVAGGEAGFGTAGTGSGRHGPIVRVRPVVVKYFVLPSTSPPGPPPAYCTVVAWLAFGVARYPGTAAVIVACPGATGSRPTPWVPTENGV